MHLDIKIFISKFSFQNKERIDLIALQNLFLKISKNLDLNLQFLNDRGLIMAPEFCQNPECKATVKKQRNATSIDAKENND